MQTVSLDSVSKVYDRQFALRRISMEFRAGEWTLLVGDNGSGKTTLLTLLATLEPPTRGTIAYDDVGWEGFADHYREEIGWIAHDSLLYDSLTGRENLAFYARMYGLDDVASTVEAWLERVGLEEAADRRVGDYSRGMGQRLSIARALLQDPSLLLLDEPLSGLDRDGRRDVLDLLEELRDRAKIVVVASHALSTIGGTADRVAVLRRGELACHRALDAVDTSLPELYQAHA